MKKSFSLPIFWLIIGLIPCFSQPIWPSLIVVGAESKIIKKTSPSRFSLQLLGSLPTGEMAIQNIGLSSLQMAAFAPETMELLSQKLGGTFFIGDPSGQKTASFEMKGSTRAMPGIRLGLQLGNRFEIRAGILSFQNRWSGRFPVVVLPHQQDPPLPPKTLEGTIMADLSGILTETDLAYFVGKKPIRPFLKGGIRTKFTFQNSRKAEIAGVILPLSTMPTTNRFSVFGGAGVRASFLKNGFFETALSFGKVAENGQMLSIEAGFGWKF